MTPSSTAWPPMYGRAGDADGAVAGEPEGEGVVEVGMSPPTIRRNRGGTRTLGGAHETRAGGTTPCTPAFVAAPRRPGRDAWVGA